MNEIYNKRWIYVFIVLPAIQVILTSPVVLNVGSSEAHYYRWKFFADHQAKL